MFEEEEVNLMAATMPFMDSQLHALYHNVELEKNIEFVVDLLTNYHRYCYSVHGKLVLDLHAEFATVSD